MTLPKEARQAIGLKVGDLLECIPERDGILLRPKVVLNRDDFNKMLRKEIEASKADVEAGRTLGPFKTAGAALRALKHRANARAAD